MNQKDNKFTPVVDNTIEIGNLGKTLFTFEFIDWKLLVKQKETLENVILLMKTKSKYVNLNDDPIIQDLNGIVELIDNLQDHNCKE